MRRQVYLHEKNAEPLIRSSRARHAYRSKVKVNKLGGQLTLQNVLCSSLQ